MQNLQKKNVTGKTSAHEELGGSLCRVDGSVTSYTVKRAVNDIKHVWKHDYKEDWHKLKSWGREYKQVLAQVVYCKRIVASVHKQKCCQTPNIRGEIRWEPR